jgi:hypothetical protein
MCQSTAECAVGRRDKLQITDGLAKTAAGKWGSIVAGTPPRVPKEALSQSCIHRKVAVRQHSGEQSVMSPSIIANTKTGYSHIGDEVGKELRLCMKGVVSG